MKNDNNTGLRALAADPLIPLFALVFALMFVSYFPGILSYDAAGQLAEALAHDFHDWGSPTMSWIWSLLNLIYVGPALYLLIDQAIAFVALGLILRSAFPSWQGSFYALLAIVFLPPNFIVLGTISKEGLFCPTMMLALAILYRASMKFGRPSALCVLGTTMLLFFSISIRAEGVAPALPIFIWMIWQWLARKFPHQSRTQTFLWATAGSLLACLLCLIGVRAINDKIVQGRHFYPEQVTLYHDLAAISVGTGRLLFPANSLTDRASLKNLQLTYDPADCMPLIWSPNAPVKLVSTPEGRADLARTWRQEILLHPGLYLAHRARIFCLFIGIGNEPWFYPLALHPFEQPPEFYQTVNAHFNPSVTVRVEGQIYRQLERFFLFRPGIFILLDFIIIVALVRFEGFASASAQLALIAALSGLCHAGVFFLAAPAPSVRYALWLILSASLSFVLWISLLLARRNRVRPRAEA